MKSCQQHKSLGPVSLILLFTSLSWQSARAGNMDGVIHSEYPNRILTLRHFYSGDHLHFNADGTLVDDAPVGTWAVDGQLEFRDASIERDVLTIKGRRIYQVYDSKSGQFVDELATIGEFPDKQRKELEKTLRRRQVEIRIEMPPTPDPKEIPVALHSVFLAPDESMLEVVPNFWRGYFGKRESRSDNVDQPAGVFHVKPGEVSAPKATFSPNPDYTEAARQLKFQGTVILSIIVGPNGTVRNVQITRPLGLGLDEKAVAAVSQWKFEPAQKDGKPVPVISTVEVDFRLN